MSSEATKPKGHLTFKAIRLTDAGRVTYIGAIPIYDLIDKQFIAPVASHGLSPEILKLTLGHEPIQRKTNPGHVQAILDYIVEQAESGEPWAFNAIVLYSTSQIEFEGVSIGLASAGEARATEPLSVGEGLHRCLAWAVALGIATVKGVKRTEMSESARRRIHLASIPAVIVEEDDLSRQRGDFNKLNQQKPLTATVLNLTDNTQLSALTRQLISDVPLFSNRIDLNNASVGANSDKLLSFSQLRFIVASYLLGRNTRTTRGIDAKVATLTAEYGDAPIQRELKNVFTQVANRFGGLERLHRDHVPTEQTGEFVRTLRRETLLASTPTWRALFIALHDAKQAGIEPQVAIDRLKQHRAITWARSNDFFKATLLEVDPDSGQLTGKLLSTRESIDSAADKLLTIIINE